MQALVDKCEFCLKSKPSTQKDRGLVGSLPIPPLSNDILYIDFISMDNCDKYNYVLTIVDGLSRFAKFIPCTKNITGEETLKVIFQHWIQHYGKPTTIMSDNDVRFSQTSSFYQKVFKSFQIKTKFSLPRHPQSNGLCERTNRAFLQNLRALSMEFKTMDWPKLTPIVTWLMNSQVNPKTGYSPSELFLGKPSWKLEVTPEMESTPSLDAFLQEQMLIQENVQKRLQKLRTGTQKSRNTHRVEPTYMVGEYVLVHKDRWPQKHLKKVESPWFGPYQILEVRSGSLKIAVSPSLGGEVLVALCHVKKWSQILEHDEEFSETDFSPGQNDPDEMSDKDADVKDITTPENSPPKVAQPPQQISQEISDKEKASSSQHNLPKGYYNVEAILKHKYDQGWKFLTKWESFPMASSTWEPPRSFKLGKICGIKFSLNIASPMTCK